jgi:hypothetical protein
MSLIEIRAQIDALKKEYSETKDYCKLHELFLKIDRLEMEYLHAMCYLKTSSKVVGYYVLK